MANFLVIPAPESRHLLPRLHHQLQGSFAPGCIGGPDRSAQHIAHPDWSDGVLCRLLRLLRGDAGEPLHDRFGELLHSYKDAKDHWCKIRREL